MFLVKGGEDLRLDQRIEQVNSNICDNVILLTNGWSVWLSLPYMAKHLRWKTLAFRVENGYLLENFCGSMLVHFIANG